MQICAEIAEKILTDNIFSLEMCLYMSQKGIPIKQLTIEGQAKRRSDKLLHPICIDFYKSKGIEEYLDKQS
ncbi:hypothetical protein HZP84_03870 [Elizabethkingia anophelis]|uniref:hypothetical protein n=1 Tax=Elizabethkingia meningoseptica TaxID=238 RepID=UPI0018C30DA8|nr:hypothetical protein [Elizabethkingia meningoseptica]MCT3671964.1 hypothetical protein [Elizabethkingia anophelis]MBG0515343.1 hypothetical protein [Elizabethkingia meningoseptica]MCT3679064.1 hypothetical protein [Elizabethkingia anophelis]MCT4079266.1 hypothetical protein [Elizabethkingia anophelis]MCT4121491.1 hypothetical protein [Elizabethkingia anophelis]